MKNTLKKIIMGTMAVLVCVSLSVPAFAADDTIYDPDIENKSAPEVIQQELDGEYVDSVYVQSIEYKPAPEVVKQYINGKAVDVIVRDQNDEIEDENFGLLITALVEASKVLDDERLEVINEALEQIKSASSVHDLCEKVPELESLIFSDLFDLSILFDDGTIKKLDNGEKASAAVMTNFKPGDALYVLQFSNAEKWVDVNYDLDDNGVVLFEVEGNGPIAFVTTGDKDIKSPQTADTASALAAGMIIAAAALVVIKKSRH